MASKHLIFDFGNVLIGVDEELTYNAFKDLGADPKLEDNKELFHSFDTGRIDTNEFLASLKEYFPKYVSKTSLLDAWNALLLEIPESSYSLLNSLAPHYKMALLSNTSVPHIKEIGHQAGPYNWKKFRKNFEGVHYSFDLKCRKPNEEIYQKVTEHHSWDPESCILVDDRIENLKTAQDLGWSTVHFALDQEGDHKVLEEELISML